MPSDWTLISVPFAELPSLIALSASFYVNGAIHTTQ
jgi:hypothetical protein